VLQAHDIIGILSASSTARLMPCSDGWHGNSAELENLEDFELDVEEFDSVLDFLAVVQRLTKLRRLQCDFYKYARVALWNVSIRVSRFMFLHVKSGTSRFISLRSVAKGLVAVVRLANIRPMQVPQ
jgi:hypothetical protein